MFEVLFRGQDDCPYLRFSVRHPRVTIAQWCNWRADVFEIQLGSPEEFAKIEPDLRNLLRRKGARILRKTFIKPNVQIVTTSCRDELIPRSIGAVILRNFCFGIPPIVYSAGWESRRVVGFREIDYKRLFHGLSKLGPVEVLRKTLDTEKGMKDISAISSASLFSGVTDKQVQAIEAALDWGYYHVPRYVTTEEVAQKLKVPRTTYEEHLRKAECKVINALAPFIRLRSHSPVD
jgi:predicted DNA binding protein